MNNVTQRNSHKPYVIYVRKRRSRRNNWEFCSRLMGLL